MALDSTVRARIDVSLKGEVEKIFKELGLTTTQAINMFYATVKREKGIPFELKLSKRTAIAYEEAKNMDGDILLSKSKSRDNND